MQQSEQGVVAAPSIDDKIAQLSKKASEFEPKAAAFWKDGEHVPFLFLARALDLISNESGRIAITEILCNVFRTVIATTPGDLLSVVYIFVNKVAPAHEGVELGIGDASIIKALAEAFGRKEDQVFQALPSSLLVEDQKEPLHKLEEILFGPSMGQFLQPE